MPLSKEERAARTKQRAAEEQERKEQLPSARLGNSRMHFCLRAGEDSFLTFRLHATEELHDDVAFKEWRETSLFLGDPVALAEFIHALSCRLLAMTDKINAAASATVKVMEQAQVKVKK